MNKKTLIIIIVAAVLVIGGIVGAVMIFGNKSEEVAQVEATPKPKKKKVTAPINIIPIANRPFVELKPFLEKGKNLEIVLNTLPLAATEGEYEIEYTIGGATAKSASGGNVKMPDNEATEGVQGFIGELDLSKLPVSTEKMLGSCSAGGACIYHSGVTDGKITLRFSATPENYAVQSEFAYFETGTESNASVDGTFTIDGKDLAKESDFLIVDMMGLGNNFTNEIIIASDSAKPEQIKARAYGVYFSSVPKAKEATITFSDIGDATKIFALDGRWVPLEVEKNGNTLTATVPVEQNNVFALVK